MVLGLYIVRQIKSVLLSDVIKHRFIISDLINLVDSWSDAIGMLDIILSIILHIGSHAVMPRLESNMLSLSLPECVYMYTLLYCMVIALFTLKPAISSTD